MPASQEGFPGSRLNSGTVVDARFGWWDIHPRRRILRTTGLVVQGVAIPPGLSCSPTVISVLFVNHGGKKISAEQCLNKASVCFGTVGSRQAGLPSLAQDRIGSSLWRLMKPDVLLPGVVAPEEEMETHLGKGDTFLASATS